MEKVLGQSEIDALFAGANLASAQEVKTAIDPGQPFNFARAGQISNEQLRAISTVNDLFARNLMHSVGAWLRSDFEVKLVSGEQMIYTEFVERIPEQTFLCSIRLEPLGAVGLLEFELALASPIVDLLLGGTGKAEAPRALTDIEELIMTSVVQIIIKELNVAWHSVGLQFNLEKREGVAQIARMMPIGEKTLCVCFEISMANAQGMLNLCLPAVVLNTILRTLIADGNRPRRRTEEVRTRVRELVGSSSVGSVLQFPPVRLQAREIAALEPGTVLRLPIARHAAAELRVGGLSLGSARPVRLGEHRGARMEGTISDTGADAVTQAEGAA